MTKQGIRIFQATRCSAPVVFFADDVFIRSRGERFVIDGEAINQLDSTGEEVLHHLAERLENNNVHILVARMKKQFMDAICSSRLIEVMGEENFFSCIQRALDYAWDSLGDEYDRTNCPLRLRQGVSSRKKGRLKSFFFA